MPVAVNPEPSRRTGRFRHVVFADAIDGAGRALDLAPPLPSDEADGLMDVDQAAFLKWVFKQGGLDVRSYRSETLARRLPACLRKLRATHVGQARTILRQHPQMLHDALSALLIGVTGFFRDANVFDELAVRVLPELLNNGRRLRPRPLRIWSVGCSSGAELYSVAMLLAERADGIWEGSELLGTDCRIEATRHAAAGEYDEHALQGVSAERLARHFARVPGPVDNGGDGLKDGSQRWRIGPALRSLTRWRTADALATTEPGPWDLILCRNTALYLRSHAAARLWDHLSSALASGGYLVLGNAERPAGAAGLSSVGQYLYRRSG